MAEDFADFVEEGGGRKGFLQEGQAFLKKAAGSDYVFGVTGHVKNADMGAFGEDAGGQFTAAGPRHDHVGQE